MSSKYVPNQKRKRDDISSDDDEPLMARYSAQGMPSNAQSPSGTGTSRTDGTKRQMPSNEDRGLSEALLKSSPKEEDNVKQSASLPVAKQVSSGVHNANHRGGKDDYNAAGDEPSRSSESLVAALPFDQNASSNSPFNSPLPPKVTPWPFSFPQPTQRYNALRTCPINWDAFPKLTDAEQRAYMNRAPWDSTPNTFKSAALYEEEHGFKKTTEEGVRKRFKRANRAIYEAARVYFVGSSCGLVDGYGVPNDTNMAKLLKDNDIMEIVETAAGVIGTLETEMTSTMTRETARISTTTKETATTSTTIQETRPDQVSPPPVRNSQDDTESCSEGPRSEETESSQDALSTTALEFPITKDIMVVENANSFMLRAPGQLLPALRYVPREMFSRMPFRSPTTLPISGAAFDLWYTCICFGPRVSLPGRLYKLRQLPDKFIHEDEGILCLNTPLLLEAYCMSQMAGTPDVSDMFLDTFFDLLESDSSVAQRFSQGKFWEPADGHVMRFIDLRPEDIGLLWHNTVEHDPMRLLVSDILEQRVDEPSVMGMYECIDDEDTAVNEYADLDQAERIDEVIRAFMSGASKHRFCRTYHTHWHKDNPACYRSASTSARSTRLVDGTLERTNELRTLEHGGVIFTVQDAANGAPLDVGALHSQEPGWSWERVQAIGTFIKMHPDGRHTREFRPVYFPDETMDDKGRFPSHPSYKNCGSEDPTDLDSYKNKLTLKTVLPPPGAQHLRQDEVTGDFLFDIEDDQWQPPPSFARHLTRGPNQSLPEWHEYRRYLWKLEGGRIPLVTCKRFRPFDGEQFARLEKREDTFRDRSKKR